MQLSQRPPIGRRFNVRQQFTLRWSILDRRWRRFRQPGLQGCPAGQCILGLGWLWGGFLYRRGHWVQLRERVNLRSGGVIERLLNAIFRFGIELCSESGIFRYQEFPGLEGFLWRPSHGDGYGIPACPRSSSHYGRFRLLLDGRRLGLLCGWLQF